MASAGTTATLERKSRRFIVQRLQENACGLPASTRRYDLIRSANSPGNSCNPGRGEVGCVSRQVHPEIAEGAENYRLDKEISSTTAREGSVATSHTHSARSSGWSMRART